MLSTINSFLKPTWLLALASASILTGCQDLISSSTLVEGQIVESQGRQPVGNATVQVYQAGKGGGYVPVGSGYAADAQGRFSFRFEAEDKSGYLLMATAAPGYITDWGVAPSLTAGRKNKDLVVPMIAPAWVRLQLVDELPKSNVSMFISGYNGSGDRLNSPHDTTLIRPTIAGFSGKINWAIQDEKGVPTEYSQNVQMEALDTLMVPIRF